MSGAVAAPAPSSMGRDASLRLSADVVVLVMGFVAGVVTARVLGPPGKGTLAVLVFLGGLLGQLGTLGLGEAAIVWFGRRRVSLQAALSGVMPGVVVGGLLGAVGLWVASVLVLGGGEDVRAAILISCLAVIVGGALTGASHIVNAVGNFGLTS